MRSLKLIAATLLIPGVAAFAKPPTIPDDKDHHDHHEHHEHVVHHDATNIERDGKAQTASARSAPRTKDLDRHEEHVRHHDHVEHHDHAEHHDRVSDDK